MASKGQEFVHLHVHTEYSLLDGLSKIKALLKHVSEQGMKSVAITDHGVMYGAVEFYKKAKEAEIKPIIGMEAYTATGDHKKKEKGKNYHLTLLAKNSAGYKNLMRLTSIAHLEGFYYKPRFDKDTLKKYSEGLIVLSGCPQAELPQAILEGDEKKAKKIIEWFVDVFGDDYYLEIQRHKHEQFVKDAKEEAIKQDLRDLADSEGRIGKAVVEYSREYGIPIVATNDSHYIKKEDARAQDALVCIATGKNVGDLKRLRYIDSPSFYMKSPAEMKELFVDLPDAIENSVKVAHKCNVEIVLGQFFFPKVDLPKGDNADEHLANSAREALKARLEKPNKEYKDRLEYELKVIKDKGYSAYFLIFKDMADWANERKIPINVRGSVAGSLVTYVLGITTVDPIFFHLPFERFLNPFRPSAPDIDLDIADDTREEMLTYLVDKYGREKVAQICTFGRMLARGSVRDVARVLGYDYATGDRLSKAIPMGSQGFPMTIDRALAESEELAAMYESDETAKKIIDLAKQIEGNARHVSVHAAGVVISPGDLQEFTPLQLEPSGEKIITQYEMWSCEDVGLVKLDVLGIRNLSILREAVRIVEEVTGDKIELLDLPLDDKKTFEMLARGETMGVFQLSGSGMTRYLVDMVPEKIEDIMIMIALFRPGPMQNIDEYIARKKGKKPVTYYHPKMEKFLDKSLGVLVYQDDLLYTALELANYNWEEVDKFRKAVGKKIPEEMAKQHVRFVEGCMEHSGMSKKEAEGLWELFEPFQGYGFNKAHSASYGMVAYQTAYMKANYPVEYMTALLTAESGDTDKVTAAVNECRRMGIKVLPPDINESDVGFTISGGGIRFGLGAIKHVGDAAIAAILEARESGAFRNLADFIARVDGRRVNKKVLESLIKVGALSIFGPRAGMLDSIDEIRAKVSKKGGGDSQQGLFGSDEMKKTSAVNIEGFGAISSGEFSDEQLQSFERQLLGLSLSAKPIGELLAKYNGQTTHKVGELEEANGEKVKLALVVDEVRVIITKKGGQEMAFVKCVDETGSAELVVFPRIYSETRSVWMDNNPVLIDGKIDRRDEKINVIVDAVITEEQTTGGNERLFVNIPEGTTREQLVRLRDLLKESPGKQRVILRFEASGRDVSLPFGVSWSGRLARIINEILEV